ncbi:methylated-DNA--[protein]-cysteine S-methyltransferase [Eionea flava]
MLFTDTYSSPLGTLLIEASDQGLTRLVFIDTEPAPSGKHGSPDGENVVNSHTNHAKKELAEYFSGQLQQFTVRLDPKGTDFQRAVWQCLSQIPFGESVSYQDIANSIDNPKAVRAVGAANGRNPIAIIVPCHRVIGKDGSLTGYAWGVDAKAWLLEHEAKHRALV